MISKAEMDKFRKAWAEVVARAWKDDLFKRKLLTRTNEALKEYGLAVPAGVNLKILEETSTSTYLVLPNKPQEELSETEMKKMVAAGEIVSAKWAVTEK
ncbi:MAG: NHLP leader peptide family RiPP precursor [Chlamydiales bacterium]